VDFDHFVRVYSVTAIFLLVSCTKSI